MNLLSLPMQIEKTGLDSRYRLAIAAAHRARQLMEGDRPRFESEFTKPTSRALEEILSGNADMLFGADAIKAQADARRARDARRLRMQPSDREEEIAAAIRKDLNVYLAEPATAAATSSPGDDAE